MSYPVKCPECSGTGEVEEDGQILDCPVCDGRGRVEDDSDFIGEE